MANEDVTEWMNTEEFLTSYHTRSSNGEMINTQISKTWSRLEDGWIKCTNDASFRNNIEAPQVGRIYRDAKGYYKGACQAKGNKVSTALESECQALIQAMQHSWLKRFRRVIFEGDCQTLHNILHNKVFHFDSHNWISDIKMWSSTFDEIKLTWQSRIHNRAADSLAKSPISQDLCFKYHFYIPHHLFDILHSGYCNSTIV